jgi:hypothetical protein
MKRILPIIAALLAATSGAGANDVPLPRPRPSAASSSSSSVSVIEASVRASEPVPSAVLEPAERSDCQTRLEERAIFHPLPTLVGAGECGAADVVRLEAILMPNRERVALTPPATLRCSMAEAISDWVREDVGAAAGDLGASLKAIENYDSYDCRGRNGVRGAKMSEHGRANALDIRSVKLANGRAVLLTDAAVSRVFRERMRQSACTRFKTVLGPGSDGYHESHIHVDLAQRNHGYAMCQWDIREPAEAVVAEIPLPRSRPVIAAAAAGVAGRSHRL